MNPEDFIAVAKVLAADATEAHRRSAVSRAYYGAFHVVLYFLHSLGVLFPKAASAHEKVAYCLQNADNAVLKAGRKLASLREMRNTADYRLEDRRVASAAFVATQLGEAEEIVAAIALAEQNPAAIRAPIRDYARSVLKLSVVGPD
jgi:uncharacterized protein (UPF0332 family)